MTQTAIQTTFFAPHATITSFHVRPQTFVLRDLFCRSQARLPVHVSHRLQSNSMSHVGKIFFFFLKVGWVISKARCRQVNHSISSVKNSRSTSEKVEETCCSSSTAVTEQAAATGEGQEGRSNPDLWKVQREFEPDWARDNEKNGQWTTILSWLSPSSFVFICSRKYVCTCVCRRVRD